MSASDQGVNDGSENWKALIRVMCLIQYQDKYLLIKRSENSSIFPGRYCGVGGHINSTEDILTGVEREVLEETGLKVFNLNLRCVSTIDVNGSKLIGVMLFYFTANSTSDFVVSDGSGDLHWVTLDKLLSLNLTDDLPYVLPEIFDKNKKEKLFFFHFTYGDDGNIRYVRRLT